MCVLYVHLPFMMHSVISSVTRQILQNSSHEACSTSEDSMGSHLVQVRMINFDKYFAIHKNLGGLLLLSHSTPMQTGMEIYLMQLLLIDRIIGLGGGIGRKRLGRGAI